tara:strand:- start:396 stop:668 length:273 start_codon:yes stop_codon:yes gene_type:complete
MKFTIKDKDLEVNTATLRQIHELEASVGNLQKISEETPLDSILKVIELILKHNPQEMTKDWILDNCDMNDFGVLSEAVAHFLTANSPVKK